MLGLQTARFNLGGSCDLLVNPLNILQTSIQGSGAGTGSAQFKIPLPTNSAYFGIPIHFQWGIADPAAPGIGIATTRAATLRL